jgi:ribosomal protein L34E
MLGVRTYCCHNIIVRSVHTTGGCLTYQRVKMPAKAFHCALGKLGLSGIKAVCPCELHCRVSESRMSTVPMVVSISYIH